MNSYAYDDFEAAVSELMKHQPLFETIIGEQFPFVSREDAIKALHDKMRPIAKYPITQEYLRSIHGMTVEGAVDFTKEEKNCFDLLARKQ